jgi:uncharacterized protein
MTTNSDVQLTADLYAAVDRGDLDAIRPHLAHDLIVDQPDGLPWSGQYHGPDGFFAFFGKLFSHVDTKVQTDHIYDAGRAIVQLGHTIGTIRSNGTAFDAPEVHALRFRDHQLVGFQVFIDVPLMQLALAGRSTTGLTTPPALN